jgi:hypothetical protein
MLAPDILQGGLRMRLVDKYRADGTNLNITGNAGLHYNNVRIIEAYDDFIIIAPVEGAERSGGAFRGDNAAINITTITRLEVVGIEQSVRAKLKL